MTPKPGKQHERQRAQINQQRQQRDLDAFDQRAQQRQRAAGGSAG